MLRKINFVLLILKQKRQTADWGMTNVCIQGRSSTQTPTSSCKWHTLIEAIVSLLKHKAVIVFLKEKKVGWTTKCWSCGVPSLESSVPEPCGVFQVWEAVLWEKVMSAWFGETQPWHWSCLGWFFPGNSWQNLSSLPVVNRKSLWKYHYFLCQ